jgi:hypothetical protein
VPWAVGGPFLLGGVCITGLGLALEAPSAISWTGTFVVASLLYASLVGTALAWVLWLGLIRAGEALPRREEPRPAASRPILVAP